MLDKPCPVNSRLASMRWPERVATALAMEIDCANATIVNANARLSRSGNVRQSTLGTWNGGQGWAMAPTTETGAPPGGTAHLLNAAAASAPATNPSSMYGLRLSSRRTSSATPNVTSVTIKAP
ncbi:hypothetical protein D3C71_1276240 [compost metagenome]